MQEVSGNYEKLLKNSHQFEVSINIDGTGCICTEDDEIITFGDVGILTGDTDADGGYKMNVLRSVSIDRQTFPDGSPTIGNAPSAEIDIEMQKPVSTLPRQAEMKTYIRVVADGDINTYSVWIPKGTFYIDTREYTKDFCSTDVLTLHGYDRMLYAEQDYSGGDGLTTSSVLTVVQEIATQLGVGVADDTVTLIKANEFNVTIGTGYSCREVLGQIAGMYGGNCVIDCDGNISIIPLFTQ